MKEFIFKTLSLTDPLAGLDVGSGGPVPPVLVLEASNQGSTSKVCLVYPGGCCHDTSGHAPN